MLRILLVEDDSDLRESLVLALGRAGHRVVAAVSVAAARPLLGDADLLLTDLRLPDGEGTALLVEGRRGHPRLHAIVMTGHATIPSAIEATRQGARHYLLKPFEVDDLKQKIAEVAALVDLERKAAGASGGLAGGSASMQHVLGSIDMAAASSAPVLITGETGTGKELAAQAIHERSSRRDGPLVTVNLAALPAELVDSELFGHEKGAFTSAAGRRRGRFGLADGGTLFLDEVNSMPLELQAKLLRAVETSEIWPVGAERAQRVDARIVAATNQQLPTLVAEGRFRADLYFRLDVLHIDIPPLRERAEDIPLIARALLDRSELRPASSPPIEVAAGALDWLAAQPWPGNVRELKNTLERALVQTPALSRLPPRIERADLEPPDSAMPASAVPVSFKEGQAAAADAWSRAAVLDALQKAGGNRAEAAKILQMNRTALFKVMKKLGINS